MKSDKITNLSLPIYEFTSQFKREKINTDLSAPVPESVSQFKRQQMNTDLSAPVHESASQFKREKINTDLSAPVPETSSKFKRERANTDLSAPVHESASQFKRQQINTDLSAPVHESVSQFKRQQMNTDLSAPVHESASQFKREKVDTDFMMPLPQGTSSVRMTKVEWSGLNYRQKHDTGSLSFESNISTQETPYLIPSQKRAVYKGKYTKPICMYGFDDFLLVVYKDVNDMVKIDYITKDGIVHTGDLGNNDPSFRSIVKFNVYSPPTDPIGGSYEQKLLIFPDKKSMNFKVEGNFEFADLVATVPQPSPKNSESEDTPEPVINAIPNIKYAAVHLSRVFGVDDDRIYASGFNDYGNWRLDTPDDYSPSNAWASPAQANTKANGKFLGITTFQNHVICFKRDFMHEIYNNKNPFRIQDIFAEGVIDVRSVQDVDGKLIFVSDDNVKVYTGGNPRDIGYLLGVDKFSKAVAGSDNRRYYLYCETERRTHNLFVYDTLIDRWADESIDFEVLSFAHNSKGMYALGADGNVYKLDTGDYSHEWCVETDIFMNQTIDIKHIQKVQLFAEVDAGSKIEAYILYDDEQFNPATSHKIKDYTNTENVSAETPIRVIPRQTANYGFKVRINGYGYARLYHLEIFMKQGGELFV